MPCLVSCLFYEDEWDGTDRHARQWCKKLRNCNPENHNETVCGWDKEASFLAQFENICVFYRANCRGAGKFYQVDIIICETKKKYEAQHPNGDEIEWIHIEGGTSASTTPADPFTATNKTVLRHKNEHLKTVYPEGGTLPPNFFVDKSGNDKEVLHERTESEESISEPEWRDKDVLHLLRRRVGHKEMLEVLSRRATARNISGLKAILV
ncbi:hypothetical protein O0L34_g3012 [Tuta absoluta]|nr:hypothetical protein O0L34_g3012 [Tuta absoluta]